MVHVAILKACRLSLAGCLLCAALGSAHGPTPAAHAAAAITPAAHKPSALAVLNPHLHIPAPEKSAAAAPAAHAVAAVTTPHTPAVSTPIATGGSAPAVHTGPHLLLAHSTAAPQWDAHAFISLHTGLTTIHGEVRNPNGTPAVNAHVALRKPGGGIFRIIARRHGTFAAANGTFTMTNVAPGSYRVFSIQAKKKGFTKIAVHAGMTENVIVKI